MTNHPANHPITGRATRTAIALALLLLAATVAVVGSTAAAGAHDGHLVADTTLDATRRAAPTTSSTTVSTVPSTLPSTSVDSMLAGPSGPTVYEPGTGLIAKEYVSAVGIAPVEPVLTAGRTGRTPIGGAGKIAVGGGVVGANADCFVDFDDYLALEWTIPNAAENTFMTNHWYQGCVDGAYYPAVAVEFMDYGHFHLGYEDPKVGPCSGDFNDWGRKADPAPSDSDDIAAWAVLPCVSDIDPVTEPRSGIANHLPGHRARIFAYEGHTDTEYLPFQLSSLEVIGDDVEICHLPPGPIVVANGGGSPWQCVTVGEGHWNLSNHVPSAIEVRIEYLGHGELDNVAIDLL